MHYMVTTVKLDQAGRVVIPKPLRDELRLAPGDSLTLETIGDGVTLHPVRSGSAMRKEHGVWVFHGGKQITATETDRAIEHLRSKRARNNENPGA